MYFRFVQDQILRFIQHFPVVAIIGPRQVGKTTLAKMLVPGLTKPSVYIDLENPADHAKFSEPLLFLQANRSSIMVIDEVQRKPDLFPILRSEIDANRVAGRFILLGSASPELLQKSSESLAGRIIYVELSPLNRLEIMDSISLETHWVRGGFPEPLGLPDHELVQQWFHSFILTFIERDVRLLRTNANPMVLSRLIQMLAHNHAQLLNKSNLAKSLEKSVPTISSYVDILEDAFLIKRLPPFFTNAKKRLTKNTKIYLRDSGLLHHFLRLFSYNDLLGHPLVGHSWEGYVIEQICSVGGNHFEYFFYRTQDGAEVDLVLTQRYQPVACIEIKFTTTPKRQKGLTVVIQDLGTQDNYIIIPTQDQNYPLAKELNVCGLDHFLQVELPKLKKADPRMVRK